MRLRAHANRAHESVRLRTAAPGRMIPVRALGSARLWGEMACVGWRVGLVSTLQAGPRFRLWWFSLTPRSRVVPRDWADLRVVRRLSARAGRYRPPAGCADRA